MYTNLKRNPTTRHKQLIMLFICHCVPPVVGMGLFPILPLYAAQLGATPTMIGLYFALLSVASLFAAVTTSWLGARFSPKRVFIGAGVMGVFALVLLGQATAFWQVVLLTSLVWFVGGMIINLIKVFASVIADSQSLGQSFSLLFLSFPLGAGIGGSIVGQLVAYRGYSFMFTMLGIGWAILPLIGFIALNEQRMPQPATVIRHETRLPHLETTFVMLLMGTLLSSAALNISRLNTSLVMQAISFSPRAIASTGIVSGLAAIPLLLVLGKLSDRMGHRRVLVLSYGLTMIGALVLSIASHLWHFQLAATLLFVAWCTNGSATAALTSALLPTDTLRVRLPQVGAMENLAGIVGFACAGWLMDTVTERGLFMIVGVLMLGAFQIVGLLAYRMRVTAPELPLMPEPGVALPPVEARQP